jgi:hypothetical protein
MYSGTAFPVVFEHVWCVDHCDLFMVVVDCRDIRRSTLCDFLGRTLFGGGRLALYGSLQYLLSAGCGSLGCLGQ